MHENEIWFALVTYDHVSFLKAPFKSGVSADAIISDCIEVCVANAVSQRTESLWECLSKRRAGSLDISQRA